MQLKLQVYTRIQVKTKIDLMTKQTYPDTEKQKCGWNLNFWLADRKVLKFLVSWMIQSLIKLQLNIVITYNVEIAPEQRNYK